MEVGGGTKLKPPPNGGGTFNEMEVEVELDKALRALSLSRLNNNHQQVVIIEPRLTTSHQDKALRALSRTKMAIFI